MPKTIGTSVPRPELNMEKYCLYILAHFHPFSATNPINFSDLSIKDVFSNTVFDSESKRIMKNWNAIHECEDEREKERMRKQSSSHQKTKTHAKNVEDSIPPEYLNDPTSFQINDILTDVDAQTLRLYTILHDANWFTTNSRMMSHNALDRSLGNGAPNETMYPFHCLKLWKEEVKSQEQVLAQHRRSRVNPSHQVHVHNPCKDSALYTHVEGIVTDNSVVPQSIAFNMNDKVTLSFQEKVDQIVSIFGLNTKQCYAFIIAAKCFKEFLKRKLADNSSVANQNHALHMFMTGPGGTGKTHVVKALKELMNSYGFAHHIRFLVPTGTAAALIDGQTVHSALGIPIHMTSTEKQELRNTLGADLSMQVSIKHREELQQEWKDVEFVLIDEVSMVSEELLCDIDIVLQDVKSRSDEWFGGVNVIFSGDFYQHKPVKQKPLYYPIPP